MKKPRVKDFVYDMVRSGLDNAVSIAQAHAAKNYPGARLTPSNISTALAALAREGEIRKVMRGRYGLVGSSDQLLVLDIAYKYVDEPISAAEITRLHNQENPDLPVTRRQIQSALERLHKDRRIIRVGRGKYSL